MRSLLLKFIRFYQKSISPYFPARCRFTPTCSQYALEAIQYHGVRKGCYFAFKRFCRCHPFYKGDAYDPVPKSRATNPKTKEENQ